MTYLFYMGHPAHFYNVINLANKLAKKGNSIIFVIREKDVLLDLLQDCTYVLIKLGSKKSNSKLSLILAIIRRQVKLLFICLKNRPNFLIGTDIVITHIGKILSIPAFVLNEDDAEQVPYLAKFGFKYATAVFSPEVCNIHPFSSKKISYNGYHELAYLHPKYFNPNTAKVKQYINTNEPYFILRFSDLNAHHDLGKRGINNTLAIEIVNILKNKGNVYISSERELNEVLERYRIAIPPNLMHHALAFAQLFIGDSQTMTAEAALLGTYSIRINDFKGKIGYLNEIEEYGLSSSFLPSQKIEILKYIKNIPKNVKNETELLRNKLILDKIDITAFWIWFFTNYPGSLVNCRNNPNYANTFKSLT